MTVCAQCQCDLTDYSLVGYDGPAQDGKPDFSNRDCHAFMEWITLCIACAPTACGGCLHSNLESCALNRSGWPGIGNRCSAFLSL